MTNRTRRSHRLQPKSLLKVSFDEILVELKPALKDMVKEVMKEEHAKYYSKKNSNFKSNYKPSTNSDYSNAVCYGCNEKGHIKPHCPKLKNTTSQPTAVAVKSQTVT